MLQPKIIMKLYFFRIHNNCENIGLMYAIAAFINMHKSLKYSYHKSAQN